MLYLQHQDLQMTSCQSFTSTTQRTIQQYRLLSFIACTLVRGLAGMSAAATSLATTGARLTTTMWRHLVWRQPGTCTNQPALCDL